MKETPMQNVYTDTLSEYEALRSSVALVDYTGIGLVQVAGPDAAAFLGQASTRSVDFLLEGQVSTALLLADDGTILAEALIHCRGDDYLVEIWPAQAAAAVEHLRTAATEGPHDVTVQEQCEGFRVYGIEGPQAPALAQKFVPFPISSMSYSSFVPAPWRDDVELLVSRTGVSGEYGYKLHVPTEVAAELREHLVDLGATEVGLDALDICRMEMRFANLEQEATGVTPFEVGLSWMVDFAHDFTGKEALTKAWESGPERRPVCWIADDGLDAAPDAGLALAVDDQRLGSVVHAVYSPRLGRVIGTARVDSEIAASGLELTLDELRHPVRTTAAPFLVATSFGVPLE
jgi:aminomethyltransferase